MVNLIWIHDQSGVLLELLIMNQLHDDAKSYINVINKETYGNYRVDIDYEKEKVLLHSKYYMCNKDLAEEIIGHEIS